MGAGVGRNEGKILKSHKLLLINDLCKCPFQIFCTAGSSEGLNEVKNPIFNRGHSLLLGIDNDAVMDL